MREPLTRIEHRVEAGLGLIVAELVIDALKHAFPGHDPGRIAVDCLASGAGWTLSVGDNGIGMPEDDVKPGLGSGIVEALARQVGATVTVTDRKPGTMVLVAHD